MFRNFYLYILLICLICWKDLSAQIWDRSSSPTLGGNRFGSGLSLDTSTIFRRNGINQTTTRPNRFDPGNRFGATQPNPFSSGSFSSDPVVNDDPGGPGSGGGGGGGTPQDGGVPIDGGVTILLALGAGMRMRKKQKQKKDTML